MWSCAQCGYQGPIVIEMKHRAMQALLKRIPKGKVTTYKILAGKLGLHQRAVASMLSANDPKEAPCHRVVASNGKVGGYSAPGGVKKKIALLKRDKIKVKNGKIDLSRYLYKF